MVCLYSESYKKYYYAPWLSMPTCVVIFSIIGVILVPFFIQFGKINFWGEPDSYYEQPVVSTTDHYILILKNGGNVEEYSSLPNLQSDETRTVSFISSALDTTFDGKNDKITCEMTLGSPGEFDYIRIMIFLNYEIKKEIHQKFWVMASIELGPIKDNVAEITTVGNLVLHQNKPFDYPEASTTTELEDKYFGTSSEQREAYKIFDDFSFNRPQVAKYDIYKETYTQTGDNLKITAEIHIPTQQKILYRRPAYINLKFRWIEYLALFIPVVFITYSIISFMFRYQLVECSVISSIPKAMN